MEDFIAAEDWSGQAQRCRNNRLTNLQHYSKIVSANSEIVNALNTDDRILDFTAYELGHVVADIDEVRRFNPQRFELEQLTAIVLDDPSKGVCAAYKDQHGDDFWTRGHMPGKPLLPGVLM